MASDTRLSKDDPRYRERLESQHGIVIGLGALPLGVLGGLFFGVPLAQRSEGFPLSILTTGVASVLLCIGVGLLILALVQGVLRLMRGFWALQHSLAELPSERQMVWHTFVVGLLFLGLALGYGLAFFIA
ncbi:MAG: hypothetical protein H0T73_09835 [Ardenticatenales bacterium]|nr:hypothetical protein [Ardenticatenales bacterium]